MKRSREERKSWRNDSEANSDKEGGKDKNPNFTRKFAKGVLLFEYVTN
jgi:hypothetical protein